MTRRPTPAALVLVLAMLLVAGTTTAGAHELDPAVRTVLDAVEPSVPGITIQVVESVTTELVVENATPEPLEVLDGAGRAWLRIGPAGVEADLASPSWTASNRPLSGDPGAGDPAASRWATVSAEPSWGWFDHRLHPGGAEPLADGETRAWSVPFRYRGEALTVRGHLERRSVLGAYSSQLLGGGEPFPGVTAQVVPGRVPGVFLRNAGPEPVIVFGAEGEPFARVGPAGAEVNARSSTWIATLRAREEPLPADVATGSVPGGEPAWQMVSSTPVLAWLEERGLYRPTDPPDDVLGAQQPELLFEWTIPLEQLGVRADVRGGTYWVPIALPTPGTGNDGVSTGVLVAASAALAGLAAAGVVLARRNRRARTHQTG